MMLTWRPAQKQAKAFFYYIIIIRDGGWGGMGARGYGGGGGGEERLYTYPATLSPPEWLLHYAQRR